MAIHQEADKKRAKKIVQIMEADEFKSENLCEYKGKTKTYLLFLIEKNMTNFRLGTFAKSYKVMTKKSYGF